jgi:hypothetical protein
MSLTAELLSRARSYHGTCRLRRQLGILRPAMAYISNRAAAPITRAKARREHARNSCALVSRRSSSCEMLAGDCTALILVFAQPSLSVIEMFPW